MKPRLQALLAPVATFACRFHPDTISMAAVALAAAAGACLWMAPTMPWLWLVAPPLLALRIACNALDGMVAKRRGLASPRGAMVNEFSDRVSDVLVLGGLAASQVAPLAWSAAALAATLLVSYLGILPQAAGGPRRYDGPLGKADRMLLVGAACLVAFAAPGPVTPAWTWTVALALFVPLGLVTMAVRWSRAWRALGGAG